MIILCRSSAKPGEGQWHSHSIYTMNILSKSEVPQSRLHKMAGYPQTTFQLSELTPNSFIARKRHVVLTNTLAFQLNEMKKSGRYDAFKLHWKEIYKEIPEMWPVTLALFWDSDIAKWIEGACYFLQTSPSPEKEIQAAVDEIVGDIIKAQQSDGYINIHFTVVDPERRWSNLRDMHELYNCGHLVEASLAHWQATGKRELLDAMERYVELLEREFGPETGKRHGYPGHPELEQALLRLASVTGSEKARNLGRYFLKERGNPHGQDGRHFYDWEADQRGDHMFQRPECYPFRRSYWYQQAQVPICEQKTVEGHAVRAMYLLTGAADMVLQSGDEAERATYKAVLERLWDDMVDKKMYLTGGIGAMGQWEGFGIDYFLPQALDEGGCYAETCAAIGVMFLAERMLKAWIFYNVQPSVLIPLRLT
jgi:DUF1680 family protein